MIIKTIVTALTGIGGHFLNKKWEKALLFQCLFCVYIFFCWFVLRSLLLSFLSEGTTSSDDFEKYFLTVVKTASIINLSGLFVMWFASLFVTMIDAKKFHHSDSYQWTKTKTTSAILTSCLTSFLLVFNIVTSISPLTSQRTIVEDEANENISNFQSYNFYEYVYFGGTPKNSDNLPAPPFGNELILGKISYNDKPAVDILLSVILNSRYKAKNIITDSNGIFKIALPPGQWTINSIQTKSWQNKPDNDSFTIYHGGEAKLEGASFDPHSGFPKKGYQVTIDGNKDKIHLNLTIKDNINVIWPNPNQAGIKASIEDSIRWEPYPKATKYYVVLNKLTKEGTTTYYNQVTSKVLSGETFIPLSTIGHTKTSSTQKNEYAARIYAFSDDGKLIGEFSDTYRGGSFILSDGNALIKDDVLELLKTAGKKDPEKIQKKMESIALQKRRINAVKVLIDENMVSEAEDLLRLVISEYVGGEKEILYGYIYGLQGLCTKAKQMFDQAIANYENVCIPGSYKDVCTK